MQPKKVVAAALGVSREVENLLLRLQVANAALASAVGEAREAGRFFQKKGLGEITLPNFVFEMEPRAYQMILQCFHFPTKEATLHSPIGPFSVRACIHLRPGQIPPEAQVTACVAEKQTQRFGPMPLGWGANLLGIPGAQFNIPALNMFPVRAKADVGGTLHSDLFPERERLLEFLHLQADVVALLIQFKGVFLLWQGKRVNRWSALCLVFFKHLLAGM
jgi:hypothetical protein